MTSLGLYLKLLRLISQTKWLFKVKRFVILHWHVSIIDSFVGPNAPRGHAYMYLYYFTVTFWHFLFQKWLKLKLDKVSRFLFKMIPKNINVINWKRGVLWTSHNRISSTDSKVTMQTIVDYKWQEVLALVWILWFQDLP